MSDVPEEIVLDILSRLPVENLVRFRCVCKQWNSLIEDPIFIKSHLKFSFKTNSNRSLIFAGKQIDTPSNKLFSMELDSLGGYAPRQLNLPFEADDNLIKIVGTCNGVLCLLNIITDNNIIFLNPITRDHHNLPQIPADFQDSKGGIYSCQYGFGYDHLNDDYKLIRIKQFYTQNGVSPESDTRIYSLKSDSWRRITYVPYLFPKPRCHDMLVSGSLHWVVTENRLNADARFIAAFDLGTEEFRLVPQPDYFNEDIKLTVVGVLGGCLSVIYTVSSIKFDIWVMKSYGVKESWTKLLSIAQPFDFLSYKYLRAVAYSKTGDKLLIQDDNELVWYDLKNKTLEKVEICDLGSYFDAEICLGSLVQISGFGGNVKKQIKTENGERKKKSSTKRDNFPLRRSKRFKLAGGNNGAQSSKEMK